MDGKRGEDEVEVGFGGEEVGCEGGGDVGLVGD